MKKKLNMEVGQKYKGYGLLNEFGEFEFTPVEVGSRDGVIKKVTSGAGYEVSTTRNYILLRVKVAKKNTALARMAEFCRVVDKLLKILREYDF